MSEFGSRIAFKELFALHQRVRVPIIQRDYAQGRESEKEVRDEFLDALHSALILPPEDESLPLNLDFIYGSIEGDGITRFLPLDGQQRLTTLFLLHWYLAWRDGCWDEFRLILCSEGHSRFAYKVRPSSTEFFDALVGFEPEVAPEAVESVSEIIADQPWYFRNWRLDPTIQSSLAMLDAIHHRFKNSSGLFDRITNTKRPAITFQLLDLENFGLSDDLYIKMNARGKPLTPFENFKARFEQALEGLLGEETYRIGDQEIPVAEFFSQRMDTQWTDFFWPHRNPETNTFDEAFMNLFRTVVLITRSPDSESFINDVNSLRDSKWKNTYSFFYRHGWLDRPFSEMLILLLEIWSEGGRGFVHQLPNTRYFDEAAAFSKAVSEPENFGYEELVQLFGYAQYLKEKEGDINQQEFQEWMRIVFNLSVNTEYNRPADLQRSFAGLLNLSPHLRSVLQHFAVAEKPAAGFYQQQIAEEKLKAQLLVERPDWRSLIDQAERHGYFRGQIDFLLDFSGAVDAAKSASVSDWDDATHLHLQTHFGDCLQKAEVMFTSSGLRSLPDFRWERALLCIGDYLLPRGSNHSFLANPQTDPASWKRLLRDTGQKRDMLGQLWKQLAGTGNLEAQLDAIIADANNLEQWREALVRTPAAISYCSRRFIRWNDAYEVYLLRTSQMNGTHAELFTYCLYMNRLKTLWNNGSLKPFQSLDYHEPNNTESMPCIVLKLLYGHKRLHFDIEYQSGEYIIFIMSDEVTSYPMIEATLVESLGFTKDTSIYNNVLSKSLTPDLIDNAVIELGQKLAGTPSPEQNNG